MTTLLTNCHVIPCITEGEAIIHDAAVLIEGKRIKAVGKAADFGDSEGVQIRNLGGRYVMPGLMNMHVHLGLSLPGATQAAAAKETEMDLFARALKNAHDALHAGVTFVRCVGEKNGLDFALRRAFTSGLLQGPNIVCAGRAVIITGGHGWQGYGSIEADGADEWRKAARSQLKLGADLVKLMITGGIAGEHEAIRDAQATFDEMQAACEAAHNAGKHATAHAGSPKAIQDGINAGLDCIEHGYFLDDATVELMIKKGTWLCPTLCVSRAEQYMRNLGVPQYMINKSLRAGEDHAKAYQLALNSGVKIAMGTDMLPGEPNEGTVATYREMEFMSELGMAPHQVLLSATRNPAQLNQLADQFGAVAAGYQADLIALTANPAENTRNIRSIDWVMKGGAVYRNDSV